MCEYVNGNQCRILHDSCPYMYYCTKTQGYRPSRNMPTDCNVKANVKTPKGYYKVIHERKGYLYIDYKGNGIQVPNPFDEVPLYVKVRKNRNGQYTVTL